MSACDNCLLYQAEIQHCKIGKPVHQLFCSMQGFQVSLESLPKELEQLRRDMDEDPAEPAAPLQIGKPYDGDLFDG